MLISKHIVYSALLLYFLGYPVKKIILIRPPTVFPRVAFNTSQGVPPIGLAYLSGSLRQSGYDVEIIDAFGEDVYKISEIPDTPFVVNGITAREIVHRIPHDVALLGFSCMFSNEWVYHRVVINEVAKAFPDVPIIAGGEHITADYERVFKDCPEIFACALGEGEETLIDFFKVVSNNNDLNHVQGIVFKDASGKFVKTPPRKRIRNLDAIPWPDWSTVPLENYHANGLGMGTVRGRNMPMLLSRGCPFECTFCSNPTMWGRKWDAREPADVIKEIKHYITKFNIDHVEFYDLTAVIQKNWMMTFTDLLIREDLGISWAMPSGTRSEALDAEVLENIKLSNCIGITYAPESGSEETLVSIKKKVKLDNMLKSMREAVKAGLLVKSNIVIGFPGQTMREIRETYYLIIKMAWIGVHDVPVFPFVPYPGSELFRYLVQKKEINPDDSNYHLFLAGNIYNEVSQMKSWSEHIKDSHLRLLSLGGIYLFYAVQFLIRPWRFLTTIKRLITSKPVTMFERVIDGIIGNYILGKKSKKTLQKHDMEYSD